MQCILTLNEVCTLFLVHLICVIFVHVILLHFRRVKRARMKPMRYIIFKIPVVFNILITKFLSFFNFQGFNCNFVRPYILGGK